MIAATVTGNVGKDATVRDVDGTSVLSFSLASRRYEKGSELTDWVDVSFWGKRASSLAQYVTKGARIAARGAVWLREYTHNNEKRYSLTMRADDVELLGSNEKSATTGGGGSQKSSYSGPQADDLPFVRQANGIEP